MNLSPKIGSLLLMEEILDQLRLVVYPITYKVLYIPGCCCLGFLLLSATLGNSVHRTFPLLEEKKPMNNHFHRPRPETSGALVNLERQVNEQQVAVEARNPGSRVSRFFFFSTYPWRFGIHDGTGLVIYLLIYHTNQRNYIYIGTYYHTWMVGWYGLGYQTNLTVGHIGW